MKKGILSCLLLFVSLVICPYIYAESSTVEVPAGRSIDIILDVGLNSTVNRVGDTIITHLKNGFYDNSEYILPSGSKIEGKITHLEAAGPDGRDAKIKVQFTSIITPYGNKIPLSAVIETKNGSGMLVGRGKSAARKFGGAFVHIGKRTATTAAKGAAIKAVTPKNIRKAIKYTATGAVGVDIVKDVKSGEDKAAAVKTAEQVVKYTPYGRTYKYGKAAYKGIKDAKSSSGNADGYGHNIDIAQGSSLDIVLLKPLVVKVPVN